VSSEDLEEQSDSSTIESCDSEEGTFFIEAPTPSIDRSANPIAMELHGEGVDLTKLWEKAVRANFRDICSNCGYAEHLRVRMIVPLTAGGRLSISNGVLLCRACDLARRVSELNSLPSTGNWPVNFWVSRSLHNRILDQTSKEAPNSFQSISSLLRFLISSFVEGGDIFEDLDRYQDSGNDVKVNVWVERPLYEVFQAKAKSRGWTVTDTLRALIRLYDVEAGSLLRKTQAKLEGAPKNGTPLPTDSEMSEINED